MPFWPVVGIVPAQATAPALIVVGWMMMVVLSRAEAEAEGKPSRVQVGGIDFANIEVGFPVTMTMLMMPFTYSITDGIGAGFITWTLIKVFRGKFREVHPVLYVVSAAFVIYFLRHALGLVV
jgi:AGZA family xanthine/uracil permease-like MFS transporter